MKGRAQFIVLSQTARRSLRQIEPADKQVIAAAMRARLPYADPDKDTDVISVDPGSLRDLGLDPSVVYLLLAVPPVHYILYRRLTDAERRQQSKNLGEDLAAPCFLVADILEEL